MFGRVRLFLELIRFSHTVFALPFALLSAVLAWQSPDGRFRWLDLIGIVLCMVFARSAAMAFNRLADRRFDAANPRTAGRHLPAGLLSVPAVAAFLGVCVVGFVASNFGVQLCRMLIETANALTDAMAGQTASGPQVIEFVKARILGALTSPVS